MKNILFFSLILAQFSIVYGQKPRFHPQVHEFGLQLGYVEHIQEASDFYAENLVNRIKIINGVRYKYHHTINDGFRLRIEQRNAAFELPEGINRFSEYAADKEEFHIALGYERKYHQGPLQLYAGADLFWGRGNIRDSGVILATADPYASQYFYNNLGANLAAGFRIYASKQFSIAFEGQVFIQENNPQAGPENRFYLLPDRQKGFNLTAYMSLHFCKNV